MQARKAYSRHDDEHLPEEVSSDVTEGHLEASKKLFYETQVVVTDEETVFIAQQTKEQVNIEVWFGECRKRLYSKFRGNTATHYGRQSQITISNRPVHRISKVTF